MQTLSPFQYWLVSPGQWGEYLKSIFEKHREPVKIPVLWGVHERFPGNFDFTKSSRLKIERLLRIAEELDVPVEIIVGFPTHADTLPQWTSSLRGKEMVPQGVLQGEDSGWQFVEIPSPQDPVFGSSFKNFLTELVSILSLYVEPEGPIRRISFDMGLYNYEVSDLGACANEIEKKYGSIEQLNLIYQTNFKNFDMAFSNQGVRTLLDKRPWLASYDMKYARYRTLDRAIHFFTDHPVFHSVRHILKISHGLSFPPIQAPFLLAVDATLFEFANLESPLVYPFAPSRQIHKNLISAFEMSYRWVDAARKHNVPMLSLPNFSHENNWQGKIKECIVVCEKYLSKFAMRWLIELQEKGIPVHFTNGSPQLNEDLTPHHAQFKKVAASPGVESFLRAANGSAV